MERWLRWKTSLILLIVHLTSNVLTASSSQKENLKISPKPCTVSGFEGTCMFVWDCINTDGQHLGMCMDRFMFGSCCAHNLSDNFVLPQSTPFRPPSKPTSSTNKFRPPNKPNQPNRHGTLTIQRPNGADTLVIRQPQKPQSYYRPTSRTTTRRPTDGEKSSSKSPINNFIIQDNDLSASASISTGSWTSAAWQLSTEPSFITKTRPFTHYDKTTSAHPKPKPTKKPITYVGSSLETSTKKPTTAFKPKPPQTKPTRPSTTIQHTTAAPSTTRLTSTPSYPIYQSFPSSFQTSTAKPTTTETTIESTEVETMNPLPVTAPLNRLTVSASRSHECGVPTVLARPETRIVGGKNSPFGKWPWQVSVRRTSFFGFSSTHRCGGAVINENWIATAGHCVDDLLTSQIRIRVGEYDFSHVQEQLPYTERAVAKKVVHPKYNFFTYEYDLALVKLDQPLEFAAHISPICLPATDDLLVGMNATVTGWGRLSEGGTLPSVLQEVSVPIVSNERCKSMFLRAGRHEFIPDIFLCAGHDTGGMDSCQGDSGGPLQVKSTDGHYFLAGIISWGIGCAEANLPGVCTRISKFTPWILENVL